MPRDTDMPRDKVERIVREAYAARAAGDLEGVLRNFADHARYALAGSPTASPVPVSASGIADVRDVMRRLIDTFELVHLDILALIVDGEDAAVRSRVRLRAKGGGQEAETEFMDLVRIEGETIVSFTQFIDTALATRMLGL